jgi:endo-1,4-beta-xylanase
MDTVYARTAAAEYTSLMPASTTKWGTLEAVRGEWWFDPTDAMVAAATKAGQTVRGHTLLHWGELPAWADALTPVELQTELQTHIKTTVDHFKGKVYGWDVVSDAIDETTLQLRPGLYTTLGIGGLAQVFKWAKEADPAAQLYYEDLGIEGPGAKFEAVLKLLTDLKAQGAAIDGVGIRAHLDTSGYPSASALRTNIQRLAAIAPVVTYTEFDVATHAADPSGAAARRAAAQRLVYQQLAGVCATEAACRGLATWGISDKYASSAMDELLPFDPTFATKPAYAGLLSGFAGRVPTLSDTELLTNGDFSTADTGWASFGGGTLTVQNTVARSGSAAAVSGRMQTYEGPAQSLLGKVTDEDGVCFSARLRVDAATAQVAAFLKIDSGTPEPSYRQLAAAVANNTDWVELSGCSAVYIPANAVEATLYVAGPPAGVTMYLDDASLRKISPN